MIPRKSAVQARERLHGLEPRVHLVHLHRVEQRLIIPGLNLVGKVVSVIPRFNLEESALIFIGNRF